MSELQALLFTRHGTHGNFHEVAAIAQTIKATFRGSTNWQRMSVAQRDALDCIAMKVARICSGDQNHMDHWVDVAGYAQLVADALASEEGAE